jgi:hypothetical protein
MLSHAFIIIAVTFACGTVAHAQTKAATPPSAAVAPATTGGSALAIERFEGGSMVVPLSATIKLNERSTLKREWFVVRDDAAPATLDRTGIDVSYKSDRNSGNYRYTANWAVKLKEPITAIDVRYVVLDVFGRVIKTLTGSEVADASDSYSYSPEWRLYSENEASEAFTSIAYVASVRTASGRVYEISRPALLDQVRKVSKRVTENDLEPPKRDASKQ